MKLNKMKRQTGYRFTKQELILRLFAFHDHYMNYKGRLARFLNDYMYYNKNPNSQFLDAKKKLFERTVNLTFKKVFEGKVPAKLPITVLEGYRQVFSANSLKGFILNGFHGS
jgi:hypothetical protein